jgi:hypothetical protein
MAHFVRIDENNIVVQGVVVNNEELLIDGIENEAKGAEFCHNLLGGTWIQTSYNNNFRKQYAGVGYTYNQEADVFITPKPYDSWSLDSNCDWQPPIAKPSSEGHWVWNEEAGEWQD